MSVFFGIEYYLVYLVFSAKKCTPIGLVINNLWLKLEEYLASTEAMDKKQDKPGQKIFGDHTFIQKRAKYIKKC